MEPITKETLRSWKADADKTFREGARGIVDRHKWFPIPCLAARISLLVEENEHHIAEIERMRPVVKAAEEVFAANIPEQGGKKENESLNNLDEAVRTYRAACAKEEPDAKDEG